MAKNINKLMREIKLQSSKAAAEWKKKRQRSYTWKNK